MRENSHNQCQTFQDLHRAGIIGSATLAFTESMGFTKTSPVQEAVIPNFIGRSQVSSQYPNG